jgi:hypothetical protein
MSADRMDTLLRVRGSAERRRQAEEADATRALSDATSAAGRARGLRAQVDRGVGTIVGPEALTAHRCAAIALDEVVEAADAAAVVAARDLATARERAVAAAVDRRIAERLRDRRLQALAVERRRREIGRADDVALQTWRRR